jgi:hypothetical protein
LEPAGLGSGAACLEWIRMNRPTIYNHITNSKNYKKAEWLNETCSYFIGDMVEELATERFLNNVFADRKEIRIFADELKNSI